MKLPQKIGDSYVKFNEFGEREYAFKVEGRTITSCECLNGKKPKYIVLPDIGTDDYIPTDRFEMHYTFDTTYVRGNIRLGQDCFKGWGNVKVVLPNSTSVMLHWRAFDNGATVDFIAPENMGLKHIYHTYHEGRTSRQDDWILVADKRLKVDIETTDRRNDYVSKEHSPLTFPFGTLHINRYHMVADGHIVVNPNAKKDFDRA